MLLKRAIDSTTTVRTLKTAEGVISVARKAVDELTLLGFEM
jgi:hypothetical protein